jgi:hypothetical protein
VNSPPKFNILAACASMIALLTCTQALAAGIDQVVNDTTSFIEWAFGFKLDAAAVQSIRQGTATDMASDPASVQSGVSDMDNVMAWVAKHSPSDSAMLRSLIEPALVAAWQADTGASSDTSRTLVAAWRKHNQIIAEGRPPLRRAVVDAYIAMFEFISKQAGKTVPAGITNHDQFARRVASQYAAAPPASQMQFNQIQPLWLSLRALWAQATPAEQNAFRAAWRGKPVAAKPPPTAAPQAGLGGQVSAEEKYKEHMFVSMESQSIISSWTNPFIH